MFENMHLCLYHLHRFHRRQLHNLVNQPSELIVHATRTREIVANLVHMGILTPAFDHIVL